MLAAGKVKTVESYLAGSQNTSKDLPCPSGQEPPLAIAAGDMDKSDAVGQDNIPTYPDVPFTMGERRFATLQESVADLKNQNKDCSCTPDTFLAEITEFVKKFHQEIGWFDIPYYETAFSGLSQVQLIYFKQQIDTIHVAVNQLHDHVTKGRVQT